MIAGFGLRVDAGDAIRLFVADIDRTIGYAGA
jgi:hypothetical protein